MSYNYPTKRDIALSFFVIRRKIILPPGVSIMKAIPLLLIALSLPAYGQIAYKCATAGGMVYQDRPCPGAERRSQSMPLPSSASEPPASDDQAARIREQAQKDKAYIDQRVKARVFERERDQAAESLRQCYAGVDQIQDQIGRIAAAAPQGAPLDRASAINLQLDQQRRQTEIAALQSQAAGQRAECDRRREEFDRTYRK